MGEQIEIIINGFEEKVPADITILDLIEQFKEYDVHMIVEYNGQFIYPKEYGTTVVSEGDRVEFINPDFGG